MPLQATSGAASYDAFGGGVPVVPNYIEGVFSAYLYTGTGATQTITNGIDLSTKGGLVWTKSRSNAEIHGLFDTIRGVNNLLQSASPNQANTDYSNLLTSFNTNGFTAGADTTLAAINASGMTYTSWSFRKQPKFFDVVSWSGTGANTTISHSLGSVPACIFVKRTNGYSDWQVYHRSLANTEYLVLNTTAAKATGATRWNSTTPTSTVFSLGTDATVNASDGTYVAYLFAHDAGGFGLTGTDNVISCGSYTGNGSTTGPVVTLGYEPQWLLYKNATGTGGEYWVIVDNMRGLSYSQNKQLFPNLSAAEYTWPNANLPVISTATGFVISSADPSINESGKTFIYIAIRRGPMKVPTVGTSVFDPVVYTGNGSTNTVTSNFPVDLTIIKNKDSTGPDFYAIDRMRGFGTSTDATKWVVTNTPAVEGSSSNAVTGMGNTGLTLGTSGTFNTNTTLYISWMFKRAPSVFDEVCYTGTGSNTTQAHNLGVVPELIIVKRRDVSADWNVYSSALANTEFLVVNGNNAKATGATRWNSTTPTSSVFSIGTSTTTNASAGTYVAYLFATCAGVSKVGSYTGTGTTKQIDCGFTSGARFVLIKRISGTGDWYIWDSARGIVSGNDPYLILDIDDAEVTNTDYIDTYSAGFEISSTATDEINENGGSFIFLAFA